MRYRKTLSCFALSSTGLIAVAAQAQVSPATDPAAAQPSTSDTRPSEDIVVTARKREERLQDVPESISVLTGATLDRGNINTLKEFVALTPNLIARTTFRSNETFLTMRGLSSAQGALPPVSIIVDGVQLGSNDFINQDLLDIERIEVLRGPQGALYGQGAIAGAINIITKKPTNDFEGMIKGTYGNSNTYRVVGSISGPIVKDTLLFRLSGYQRGSDGLIKNARDQRIDGNDQTSIRGQLYLDSGSLKVNLRGSWTKGNGGCCIQDRVNIDATGNLIGVDDVTNPGATSNILGRERTRFRDASSRIDYDFGPVTLTSITGWADVSQAVYGDLDFTAAALTAQDITYDQNVFNQDLRLASNGSGSFSWIVGGFYQRRNTATRFLVGTEIPGGGVTPNLLNQDIRQRSTSQAVYAQASYKITPELEILGALRYDHDDETNVNLLNPGPTTAQAKFHALQPKAQISYKVTPDIMLYATYSQGFRAGGFSQTTLFNNERTKNYEAGFKTQFADGRFSINGSAFHIDYENQLLSYVVTSPAVVRRTINIPKTGIDGFELELSARPTSRLTTNFNVGFTDSVVKAVAPDPVIATAGAVGKKSPLVPPFTMSASATYRAPLGGGLDLVTSGTVQRRGGYFFDLTNTIYTATKTFVDANISLDASAGWSIGIFGKNLTDARSADNVSITGSRLRVPNQPRSYGVEASFKF
jgi:iron complex outermembrane recepter protein